MRSRPSEKRFRYSLPEGTREGENRKPLEARGIAGDPRADTRLGKRHGDLLPKGGERKEELKKNVLQLDIPFDASFPEKKPKEKPPRRPVREPASRPDPAICPPRKFSDPFHERVATAVSTGNISELRPLDLFNFVKRFERLSSHLEKVIRISDGYQNQLREASLRMERLARTDPLTGLSNRRDIQERLERELSLFRRYGTPFSLILFDVDDFKSANDSYGHDAGDRALQALARIFETRLRDTDSCGRWGGEEFLVLCSGILPTEALVVAEKCRKTFAEAVPDERYAGLRLTVSGGICGATENASADELVKRADKALYRAKEAGKNTVLLWSPG